MPESTLRLYRDEFEEFVPAMGEGRRRRYDPSVTETLRRIVEGKKAGASSGSIRSELARATTPRAVRQHLALEDRLAQLLTTLEAQHSEIALIRAEVGALRNEMSRLLTVLSAEKQGAPRMETIQQDVLRATPI